MANKRSFLLRVPPELWEDLKRWADADLRSVNGQIEFLLREAVRKRKGKSEEEEEGEGGRMADHRHHNGNDLSGEV